MIPMKNMQLTFMALAGSSIIILSLLFVIITSSIHTLLAFTPPILQPTQGSLLPSQPIQQQPPQQGIPGFVTPGQQPQQPSSSSATQSLQGTTQQGPIGGVTANGTINSL